MILPHVGKPQLYPVDRMKNYAMPEVAGTNHWHDWVDAVLTGQKTTDGFEYAGPLTETVQLGNIAARMPGKELLWDAAKMTFSNEPDANRLLTKVYRSGFEVNPA
jgi:hypothetical protein